MITDKISAIGNSMNTRDVFKYVLVVAVIAFVGFFGFSSLGVERYSRDIVKQCATEKNSAACYEREVPKLLSTLPLQDVFGIIRAIRRADSSYQFCHVLGHKLGEAVVAKDKSRWFEALSQGPSESLC